MFQLVPHPPRKNSGSPQSQHNQRSEALGRQPHLGQRIRLKSGVSVRRARVFFSTCSGGGVLCKANHEWVDVCTIIKFSKAIAIKRYCTQGAVNTNSDQIAEPVLRWIEKHVEKKRVKTPW